MEAEWQKVRINCPGPSEPDPPDRKVRLTISPAITEVRVRKLLQAHFPEGPEAARKARVSEAAWQQLNAARFFDRKTERPAEAARWAAFMSAWGKFHVHAEDRGIVHAQVRDKDFDFSRVHTIEHSHSRGRSR